MILNFFNPISLIESTESTESTRIITIIFYDLNIQEDFLMIQQQLIVQYCLTRSNKASFQMWIKLLQANSVCARTVIFQKCNRGWYLTQGKSLFYYRMINSWMLIQTFSTHMVRYLTLHLPSRILPQNVTAVETWVQHNSIFRGNDLINKTNVARSDQDPEIMYLQIQVVICLCIPVLFKHYNTSLHYYITVSWPACRAFSLPNNDNAGHKNRL